MTLVICKLSFVIVTSGIAFLVSANVEGKLLKKDQTHLLIDFREGLKEFPKTKNPEDYKKVLINKSDCMEE